MGTMSSIFKNPVNKTIDNLCKHLDLLQSEDKDKRLKAVSKLSEDISQIHFILYGDSDKDPNPDHISRLVPKLLQEDTDLFCKMAQYTTEFEFEAKKQTAGIMNYIIRRCSKYHADSYIKSKTDAQRHNVIIDSLLKGYHEQHLAMNVGSVLQEMAKRQELAPMLLNEIRITRPKRVNIDQQNDDNNQSAKPVADEKEETEERQVVEELFVLVEKPSFDVASDAYKTLQLLLTRNKKLVPQYLEANYDQFFSGFNRLIQSDNYVTKRQFLNLLSELLLEKTNFNLMIRYIAQKENLKVAMTLLKSDSNAISHEAFHIFKVFVANPKKARDIHIVLWKNKEKLVQFLTNFLPEKAKEDEQFAEEKKIVIKHLQELPIPEEIAQHKARRDQKKRAQSQAAALENNNDAFKLGGPQKMGHAKSVPDIKPPPTQNNDDNDQDNNGNEHAANDIQSKPVPAQLESNEPVSEEPQQEQQ